MSYAIESFAWCMLQVTLFTAIVAVVYAILRRLRPGASSALLASSLMVVGMLTIVCVSPWPRWDVSAKERQWVSNQRDAVASDAIDSPSTDEPFVEQPKQPVAKLENNFAIERSETELLFNPPVPTAEAASPVSDRTISILVIVAWVAAVFGFARAAIAMLNLHRIRRHSTAVDSDSATHCLHELCEQLGIRRSVALRESPQLGGAATLGWRRPIVLLPCSWPQWSRDELRAVLAHELAHVRQRHFPAWLASQAALVAHYYHPVVHWLGRRLRLEQEIDADRLAAHLFGDRRQYAAILARLALAPAPVRATHAGVGLFMSRPLLMRRIAMLRQSTEPARDTSRLVGVAMLLLLLVAAIGAAGLRAESPPTALPPAASPTPQPAALPDATLLPAEPLAPVVSADGTVTVPTTAPTQPSPTVAPAYGVGKTDTVTVQALLQISRPTSNPIGYDDKPISDSAWNLFSRTQSHLLKSYSVLKATVEDPKIAALPIMKAQSDKTYWLQQHLQVGIYPDTEILFVELSIPPADAEQGRKLVDAVVQSYMGNVVNAGKQRRYVSRDLVSRHLANVEDELKRKMDDFYSIAKELQSAEDDGSGQMMQQLDMRRLDRVESELMRLEDEMLQLKSAGSDDKAKLAYYDERMQQLKKRQQELEGNLRSRSEKSIDLSIRKNDLEQLRQVAREMNVRLEMIDMNAENPDQETIRVIQPAVVIDTSTASERGVR